MTVSGIQGHPLEVTVVSCNKLKVKEWFIRRDPYVSLDYGSSRFRTRTCTDGGKSPSFEEKFTITMVEGLRELGLSVWNNHTFSNDDLIGNGKVNLQKVLSQGHDDTSWTIQTKSGRYAGEVRLILHYGNAQTSPSSPTRLSACLRTPAASYGPSAPPYAAPTLVYNHPPPPTAAPYLHHPNAYPACPPSPYPSYAPNGAGYPPSSYPPPPPPSTYPPHPYPPISTYPPSHYPPQYPPGHFPGLYHPRPY